MVAFIDDHSRAIVDYRWGAAKTPLGKARPAGMAAPATIDPIARRAAFRGKFDAMRRLRSDEVASAERPSTPTWASIGCRSVSPPTTLTDLAATLAVLADLAGTVR